MAARPQSPVGGAWQLPRFLRDRYVAGGAVAKPVDAELASLRALLAELTNRMARLEADRAAWQPAQPVAPKAPVGPVAPANWLPVPARGPAPAPGGPVAVEPGAPLRTVSLTAAMKAAANQILAANPGLRNNPGELTKAVAAFVKSTRPDLRPRGDDRPAMYKCMTEVIGILRSAGVDAFRVVNHPVHAEGNPARYGSDAVVINGHIFDVFRAFGEANEPVNQDVGPWDRGRAKNLRE